MTTPKTMRDTLGLTEGMYSMKKKPRPASAQQNQASNDVFLDRSMEYPDKIAITLKGRTALINADRARAMIQKLERLLDEVDEPEQPKY